MTALVSVTQIISVRMMVYLKTIIKGTEGKLIRNVYEARKADPLKGDWYKLVQENFKLVNIDFNKE